MRFEIAKEYANKIQWIEFQLVFLFWYYKIHQNVLTVEVRGFLLMRISNPK